MNRLYLVILLMVAVLGTLSAQKLEFGFETFIGAAHTRFKGDLASVAGFSELELSEDQVDTALVNAGIQAPKWLKDLFPGVRIEVAQEIRRQMSRPVKGARVSARYRWIGASFTVSDPRLTVREESKKFKNQVKAVKLSLAGDAEGLSNHLALMALADINRVDPFFSKRYDVEVYLHLKKLLLGEDPIAHLGSKGNITLDAELTSGLRFTADPSPVIDLGNILFVQEKLDSLMEGGILKPVEKTTDAIAEAIQNTVFGKFKDPRVVPMLGWFVRGSLPVELGESLSLGLAVELSFGKHLLVKGTSPTFSALGYLGLRWRIHKN